MRLVEKRRLCPDHKGLRGLDSVLKVKGNKKGSISWAVRGWQWLSGLFLMKEVQNQWGRELCSSVQHGLGLTDISSCPGVNKTLNDDREVGPWLGTHAPNSY